MMQTFNILQSKSKIYSSLEALHKYHWIVWNYNSFLSLNLLHLLNQKYIFFEAGKEQLLLNLVFLLVTLSKINRLCLGDETKSGEKKKINASSSCEDKMLSLIGLRQETIN